MSEVEHLDDVEWRTDADGTEFFVHEGVRYEQAEDGYAYPVEPEAAEDVEPEAAGEVEPEVAVAAVSAPAVTIVADDVSTDGPTSAEVTTALPRVGTDPAARPTAAADGDPLLRLEGLRSGYGKLPVLHGVDLEVGVGQTAVLLGLNGAGKTTTAMNVAGALDAWGGTIHYDGEDATGWNSRKAVAHGIVMVPEGRRVFPDLDVSRNLQVGAWMQRRDRSWVNEQREQVLSYFPRLRERLSQTAGTLSGGEQQMLAIARGLMARPRLLIIDEASMGLAPVIVHDVFEIIRRINADGVTVLLIEQNVGALEVADVGIVMAQGRVVTELQGEQLRDRGVVSELLMG